MEFCDLEFCTSRLFCYFSLNPTFHFLQDSENSEKIPEIEVQSLVPTSTIYQFCGLGTTFIPLSFDVPIYIQNSDNKTTYIIKYVFSKN